MGKEGFLEKLLDGAGIEWVALGDVTTIKTGQSVNRQMISNNLGEYPVINSGREPLGFIDKWNTEDDPIGITTRGAGVGSITWQEGKYFRGNLNYSVTIKSDQKISIRYLYHILLEMQPDIQTLCTFDGIPALNAGKLKWFQIPIPCPDNPKKSLAIQAEIVRILDTFTSHTAELTAELTARKKQYNYYRDKLLDFTTPSFPSSGGVPVRAGWYLKYSTTPSGYACHPSKGGELSSVKVASHPSKDRELSFIEKLLDGAAVEWVPLGDVVLPTRNIKWQDTDRAYQYIDLTSVNIETKTITATTEIDSQNAPNRAQKLVASDDVIFATTRPTQQRYCLVGNEYSGEVASTGYCVLRARKEKVLPKWILYWVSSTSFKNHVEDQQSGAAYPAISDSKVKDFQIPIPCPDNPKKSLAIQAEIVRILDKFDTLTNSISEGLPHEIKLRQKQYEYYRNLLLNFTKPEEPQFPSSGGVAGDLNGG